MTERDVFVLDGDELPFVPGDTVLTAALRNGEQITPGGCLCLAGDCPHCVATVDGVSYVRTCQVPITPGLVVERYPGGREPPLPAARPRNPLPVRNISCNVVVVGAGDAGLAAAAEAEGSGKSVEIFDAGRGEEVIGIYAGPEVVVRTRTGMVHARSDEVVVATGAAEILPVCPGSQLSGIVTTSAASELAAANVDLDRVVAVGTGVSELAPVLAEGSLVRFEGTGRVEAVVTVDDNGEEHRYECDTAIVGLGSHPRDALLRMGHDLPVRGAGTVTDQGTIPPCPSAGVVCPCADVTVDDLDAVWRRGFEEMELLKRATLAGTGTCQGMACLPHVRSFLQDRGKVLQPAFTARPVTRQLTIGEVTAAEHLQAYPRTTLDAEHRSMGAQMDRIGGWWRPWTYGDADAEYWAVRRGVSIGDVSTLGKVLISGPDAVELIERLYPTRLAGLKPGRCRYVLMLNERGYVADDGLVCRDTETRFTLTFTSGGATWAEMWIRDWSNHWGLDVRVANQTFTLGAVNVTGPHARELLTRAGLDDAPPYMSHARADVANVPCRIFRLSFTGELSYELHHPAERSVELWRCLLELGEDLKIKPHGIETLLRLRLEKGHIIVGQDTDFDSTPRRLRHEWAAQMDKPDFIGRQALLRTNQIPLDKQLIGLEMPTAAPVEGTIITADGTYSGYVTSTTWSPVLEKSVMLGWISLIDGRIPESFMIDGRQATAAALPFYDPDGARARA